jgi:DNA-binding response OmpR family regulator
MSKILLLEPDDMLAGSLKHYFANANHQVYAHSDAQAALGAADKQTPDVVITQLQLADRSGIEFLYEFRSYSDWQKIPVILIGHRRHQEMIEYAEVFKELAIQTYLYKPTISLKNLLSTVEQALQPAAA